MARKKKTKKSNKSTKSTKSRKKNKKTVKSRKRRSSSRYSLAKLMALAEMHTPKGAASSFTPSSVNFTSDPLFGSSFNRNVI